MTPPTIALAGASGDLGSRIARALVRRGATVRALIRPGTSDSEQTHLKALGLTLVPADPLDAAALTATLEGVSCVVSALNGLRGVIVERQGALLDAAVAAGVPRLIPSDFSEDFTQTQPGDNRNLDLRRELMARADHAQIAVTSILNGAFMDMLGAEMPILQPGIRRVLYWHDADQPLDFTTKDDVAAYVAAAALDGTTPRFLKIAGDSLSARALAATMTEVIRILSISLTNQDSSGLPTPRPEPVSLPLASARISIVFANDSIGVRIIRIPFVSCRNRDSADPSTPRPEPVFLLLAPLEFSGVFNTF
ncbi:hypothetical protein DESA109040_09430 [Deinococcus saxicola]|uniref:NmrA family NAD(P)-binding protein n=1 Tax=Deinococcus saxicola TaxID=249406 RepID=UPI0039F0CA09